MSLFSVKTYDRFSGDNLSEHTVHNTLVQKSDARTGIVTSKEGVLSQVKNFVVSRKGDESTASYHSIFNDYAGEKGNLDRNDLMRVLNDADACVPSILGGCGKTADEVLKGMDSNGDGAIDWEEFRIGAGLEPEPAAVPVPVGPTPVQDTKPKGKYADITVKSPASAYVINRYAETQKMTPKAAVAPEPVSGGKMMFYGLLLCIPVAGLYLMLGKDKK